MHSKHPLIGRYVSLNLASPFKNHCFLPLSMISDWGEEKGSVPQSSIIKLFQTADQAQSMLQGIFSMGRVSKMQLQLV